MYIATVARRLSLQIATAVSIITMQMGDLTAQNTANSDFIVANDSDARRLTFEDLLQVEGIRSGLEELEQIEAESSKELIHTPIDLDRSIATYALRASQIPGDFANRTLLGSLMLRQAKQQDRLDYYGQSERVLRAALQCNPNYLPAKSALAHSLMASHQFKEAIELAEQVLEAKPGRAAHLATLFDARLGNGDLAEAKAILDRLKDKEDSAPILARTARIAELEGDFDAAISAIDTAIQVLQETQDDPQALVWYLWRKATLQFDSGMVAEAKTTLQDALAIDPCDEASQVGLARVHFAEANLGTAVQLLRKVAEGEAPPALALLGDALALQGNPTEAEHFWTRTLQVMHDEAKVAKSAHAREVAMFLADHDRDLPRALELARLDIKQRQDHLGWDCLAWVAYKLGDLRLASDAIEKSLGVTRSDAKVLFHAAMIAETRGQDTEVESLLREIGSKNPHFSITYHNTYRRLRRQHLSVQ